MDNRTRAREWAICEEHEIVVKSGICRLCNGDRALIQVVPNVLLDSVRREALADAADLVAAALQGIPMCGQTGCAEVAACDMRRVEAEIRALATPTKPGDETKEDGQR